MTGQTVSHDEGLELSEQGYTRSVDRAYVYTGLGNREKAFEWLEKGYAEQNSTPGFLTIDPVRESLRSDPRYASLLKKMGLDR